MELQTASDDPAREFDRLSAIYSWDMKIEEARPWPMRLLRRVLAVGTLEDSISMERHIGSDALRQATATADIGALRPKSWNFWHYRLSIVAPDDQSPPMPTRRMP